MSKNKKRPLHGSKEVLNELRISRYRLGLACRLIRSLLGEATHLVMESKRAGSVCNYSRDIDQVAANISVSIQEVTRAGNTARRALKDFHHAAKKAELWD